MWKLEVWKLYFGKIFHQVLSEHGYSLGDGKAWLGQMHPGRLWISSRTQGPQVHTGIPTLTGEFPGSHRAQAQGAVLSFRISTILSHGIFVTAFHRGGSERQSSVSLQPRKGWSEVLVALSCLVLCDPKDCNLPGASVHGILQARILGWTGIPFSRGSSWPRDQT